MTSAATDICNALKKQLFCCQVYKYSIMKILFTMYIHELFCMVFKVYKAISDSLENHKIINGILLGVILNNLICIFKFWMGSVYA